MVMEEGVATALDPDINMWETAEPFLKEWLRSELGPEAYYADRIVETVRAFKLIPDLIRKIDASYPTPGGAPPPPPIDEIEVTVQRRWAPMLLVAVVAGLGSAAATYLLVA
jgi:ubiquinone biosynthesis protein